MRDDYNKGGLVVKGGVSPPLGKYLPSFGEMLVYLPKLGEKVPYLPDFGEMSPRPWGNVSPPLGRCLPYIGEGKQKALFHHPTLCQRFIGWTDCTCNAFTVFCNSRMHPHSHQGLFAHASPAQKTPDEETGCHPK